jgi:hypothetical protein
MALSQALAVAADRPAKPNGAGDAEAEAMLAATASLPPSGRAALALTGLTDASPTDIAATMNVSNEVADGLLVRAFAGLASELGEEPEGAESAYRSWLLVEPPQELWETLYPGFYRAVERRLREGRNGAAPSDAGRSGRRARRRARRASGRAARGASTAASERPRRPRWRRLALWAAAILPVAAAGFAAATQTGLIGGDDAEPAPSGSPPAPTLIGRMSPDELDRLRLRELDRARSQAADRAARAARNKAQRKARARAVRRRKAALARRRRAERRRRLAQRRDQASNRQPDDAPSPERSRPPRRQTNPGGGGNPDSGGGRDAPRGDRDQTDECVLNESDGTYICPR